LPTNEKVWVLTAASARQMAIEGIHPVPLALPAARVRIPAPATLLARLKTVVATDAPSSEVATFFDEARGVALDLAPPPPRTENKASLFQNNASFESLDIRFDLAREADSAAAAATSRKAAASRRRKPTLARFFVLLITV